MKFVTDASPLYARNAAPHKLRLRARFPLETLPSCFYLPFTYSEDRLLPTPMIFNTVVRAVKWNGGDPATAMPSPYRKEIPWM
jgi:hypothetical protein